MGIPFIFKNPIEIKGEGEVKISGWAKDLRFETETKSYGKDYIYSGFEGKISSDYLKKTNWTLCFQKN